MDNVAHRRQYPRYSTVFSTKYRVREGTFRDLIRDIGAGGVFVRTRRTIKQGRSINLQLPIFAFEKRLSIMGTVVRCDSKGFAVMFDEPVEVKIFKDGRFQGNVEKDRRAVLTTGNNRIA